MSFMNRIFAGIGLCIALTLVLWIAIAFGADLSDYLALARSGLLLIGLATLIWGALWWRVNLVMVGLVLLMIGFLSFWAVEPLSCWQAPGSFYCRGGNHVWDKLLQGLCFPINRRGSLVLWHAAVAAFMVLNGLLVEQRAERARVIGGNVVLAALVLVLAVACA